MMLFNALVIPCNGRCVVSFLSKIVFPITILVEANFPLLVCICSMLLKLGIFQHLVRHLCITQTTKIFFKVDSRLIVRRFDGGPLGFL